MNIKREPVVIVFSILAILGVISAGLGLIDTIDDDVAAIFSLIVSALTAGASFYVRAMVTPWEDVVSKIQNGSVVAGPAATGQAPPAGTGV